MRVICCFVFIACIACSTKEPAPVTTHVVEAPSAMTADATPVVAAPVVAPVAPEAEMSMDATPVVIPAPAK